MSIYVQFLCFSVCASHSCSTGFQYLTKVCAEQSFSGLLIIQLKARLHRILETLYLQHFDGSCSRVGV